MTVGADGLEPEVSPTSPVVDTSIESPTQPVVTGEITQTDPTTTTPTPPVEGSNRDTRPRDPFGRFVEKPEAEPDPVKEALDKLAGPAKPQSLPAKEAKPASPPIAATPQQATEKPETAPKAASPDALTTDPFADYSEQERKALREKTSGRMVELHRRWTDSEAKRKEVEPLAEAGKEYTELLDSFGVREDVGYVPPDHMAGLIRVQAGINRAQLAIQQGRTPAPADLQSLDLLTENVTRLRQQFGLAPVATTQAALEPLQGDLPQDMRDLVEVYGLPEADVRLLAAIKAKPAAQAPSAPTPPPAAPVPPPEPPVQHQQVNPAEAAYAGLLNRTLASEGAGPDQIPTLMEGARKSIMRRFAVDSASAAALFNDMSAKDRFDMLMETHRGSKKALPPPVTRLPPPTTQRSLTGPTPRATTAPSSDAVIAAIERMTAG